MSDLTQTLEMLTAQAVVEIENTDNSNAFERAFETYLLILSPSIGRYRHHLNTDIIDEGSLKQRFKYETAFLHVLMLVLNRVVELTANYKHIHWLTEDLSDVFCWYSLSEYLIDEIGSIPKEVLLDAELETSSSQIIAEILGKVSRRYVGEYYTPLPIAKHLIDISGFHPADLPNGAVVVDPACGGGVILTEIVRRTAQYVSEQNITLSRVIDWFSNQIEGFDIQPFAIALTKIFLQYTWIMCMPSAAQNAELNFSKIFRGIKLIDPLASPKIFWGDNRRFNYIIGNPPYFSAKKEFLDYVDIYVSRSLLNSPE